MDSGADALRGRRQTFVNTPFPNYVCKPPSFSPRKGKQLSKRAVTELVDVNRKNFHPELPHNYPIMTKFAGFEERP